MVVDIAETGESLRRGWTGRRIQILDIAPEALVLLLGQLDGATDIRVEGLPDDAQVVWTAINPENGNIGLYIESESFQPVYPLAYIRHFEVRVHAAGR